MRFTRWAIALWAAVGVTASWGSAAQNRPERKTIPAVMPRNAFVGVPILVKNRGRWQLKFTLTGDVRALESAATAPGQHPLIPVMLRAGTWLSGVLLPGGHIEVALSDAELAAFTPGKNALTVQVPGWQYVTSRFDSAPLLNAEADLRAYAAARARHVSLPEARLRPDATWQGKAEGETQSPNHPTTQLPNTQHPTPFPLEGKAELAPPCCPGLTFAHPGRNVLVVSQQSGQPLVTIPMTGRARKIYLLLLARRDARDAVGPVARLSVQCGDGPLIARTLRFPDDLKSWEPKRASDGAAKPDARLIWVTPSTTLNVVEIDLQEMRGVESVTLETVGPQAALGVVGMTALGGVYLEKLASLSPRVRALAPVEPHTLFAFDRPSLNGWTIVGTGWGTTDTAGEYFMRKGSSRYFADSKAMGGETATGTILSPPFTLAGSRLTFLANGHGAKNYYALVDAADGKELLRAPAPEKTGPFVLVSWDVQALRGRQVRFKAVDADDRPAYAWIAFDDITLLP